MNPAEFAYLAQVEQRMWWFRGMNRIAIDWLRRYAPAGTRDVLEGGCGTGYASTLFAREFGWRMTAIDLAPEGLQYARGLGLQTAAQADLRSLPFRDGRFDAVLSLDVVVHFERGQEQQPFNELARVLKRGGLYVIRVAALDVLRSRHSEFAHERQRFTRRRLMKAVESAGVEVLRCTYLNSLLLPVSLTKFRIWEPLTNARPESGVREYHPALDRLLGWPLELEAKWIGAGLNFPAGQSLLLAGRKR